MAEEAKGSASPESAPVVRTPQDATADRIAAKLNPEQAKAFREQREAKKAKRSAAQPAAAIQNPVPETETATTQPPVPAEAPRPETETSTTAEKITMGDDPSAEPDKPDAAPEELTDEELEKLSEKARKLYRDAGKESAKVRKRAQEAEAKVKDLETKIAEVETARQAAADEQNRAVGLVGNIFGKFKSGQEVAAWGTSAQKALALLDHHEQEVKSGRREAGDTVRFTEPDGREIEISGQDRARYERRVEDAHGWFDHDAAMSKNREAADKLAEKHSAIKGYKEALAAYGKDAALAARLEELAAKAAFYDVLQARRAEITFMDAASAAKIAPSKAAQESAARKTPPSETAASTPRLSRTDDSGSDIMARKSTLMERAKTAKTEDERQRLLKEAIKLGPSRRMAAA